MPTITVIRNGQRHVGEVADNTNLVVRAGIRQFPHPHLSYGCGMGKCGKCASRILAGQQHLPAPNWKEERVLGAKLSEGCRLMCQLWLHHDIELSQDGLHPFRPAWQASPPPSQDSP